MKSITEKVDAIFSKWDKPNSPGCVLGIIQNGELVYTRGYGMAHLEHDLPITPDTVFDIASTSKQFAAACVALLVQKNQISLDDDIRKYVPEIAQYAHTTITIRHLVHHTSGLRDYTALMYLAGKGYQDHINNEYALEWVSRQEALNYQPGEEYLYCNSGYLLMAEIVERVSGEPLAEFSQKNIFAPLGMSHTRFVDDYKVIIKNRAEGYGTQKDGSFERRPSHNEITGDGGIWTTVNDLYLWDQNFSNPKVGGKEFISQMLTRGMLNSGETLHYAFGLEHGEYRGLKTIGHGGSWVGFRSHVLRFPEKAFTVICLSNLEEFEPLMLAQQVADIYLSEELAPKSESERESIDLSEEILQEKVGIYQNAVSGMTVDIFMQDGQLMSAALDKTFALRPISTASFQVVGAPARIEFEAPKGGKPERMQLHIEGETPEILEAIEEVSLSENQLVEYAGAYFSAELQTTYRLVVEDGKLYARYRNAPESPLKPSRRDVFQQPTATLNFLRDDQDILTGFSVNAGRVRNIAFIKEVE